MNPSKPALQFSLPFVFSLPGQQPLLTLPFLSEAFILSLAHEPVCFLLSFEPVLFLFLRCELLKPSVYGGDTHSPMHAVDALCVAHQMAEQ